MCLALPMKLLKIQGSLGIFELGGVKREAEISLLEKIQVGQYAIVHAGFALSVIDPLEAQKTLELFDQICETQKKIEENNK